jgi:hypothetical protein
MHLLRRRRGAKSDVLVDANKFVNYISKKAAGTSGPNTSVIAPGETPSSPGKKALEKNFPAISKQHQKKLAENKSSTPHATGKKALEKSSSDISKQQEKKPAENKSSTPRATGKKALQKPSSTISKRGKRKLPKIKSLRSLLESKLRENQEACQSLDYESPKLPIWK